MKKDRLLEIIREEISAALTEETIDVPNPTGMNSKQKEMAIKTARTSTKDMTLGTPKNPVEFVEEAQLDEIEQLAEMASMVQLKNQLEKQGKSDELEAVRAAEQATINKLKDNPEFSGEGKNIRLKGYVKNLKKELKDAHGIDLQVLLSQVAAQAEKAGEDFKDDIATNTIEKNAAAQVLGTEKSKPGPQSSNTPKAEKPAKAAMAPKAKAAMAPKAEPMDDEDAEATKAAGSDETAKKLASTPDEKKEVFNRILGLVTKYKDDKSKIDAFITKAEKEYKLPSSLVKDLKRAAGREVEA
jgi:hypothetical protein